MEEEIINAKKNIFEHVFYEIEMYLQTKSCLNNYYKPGVIYNALVESNRIHKRNLLEFFYAENINSINQTHLLIEKIDYKNKKMEPLYHYLCKITSHLSINRVNDNFETSLIETYFDDYIDNYITIFLDKLNKKEINPEINLQKMKINLQKHLNENTIQERLKTLQNIFK